MAYLVEFPIASADSMSGESIIVEMDDEQLGGLTPAAVQPGEIAATATTSFESTVERVVPALRAIGDRMKVLSPDELTVAVGVKLTAEAGVIVAKASGEANFTVTLKWYTGRKS
jgi:hypothetical protein